MVTSPLSVHPDGVRLHVHLTPSAARDGLDRVDQDANASPRLRATVTTVPDKGKANKAMIKLLAKKLRLPKSAIQIIAGHQSRDKTLLVAGDTPMLLKQITAALVSAELMTP